MKLFTKKIYATKEEYKETQEKIIKDNLEIIKNEDGYEIFEVVKIGDLVEVNCYYHEIPQNYRAVGYVVTVKSKFDFQDKPDLDKGFYPVWLGKRHKYAPVIFSEEYNDVKFTNGCGDFAEIYKVLRKSS